MIAIVRNLSLEILDGYICMCIYCSVVNNSINNKYISLIYVTVIIAIFPHLYYFVND